MEKEKFDIEKFPTSEAAKRMMASIDESFYEKSYVMKWLQQVMGLEWDDAWRVIVEELPKQFVPETATWGLRYHEEKWQLPVRENLSYEERRKLIYQKRDFKAPMTPYRMEEYLEKATGAEACVMDCHDKGIYGFVPGHPNVFKVVFIVDGTLNTKAAREALDRIKQSHTVYTIEDRVIIILDSKALEKMDVKNVGIQFSVHFFRCHFFDGTDYFDGSLYMNARRIYSLTLGIQYGQGKFHTQESIHFVAMGAGSRAVTAEKIYSRRFAQGITIRNSTGKNKAGMKVSVRIQGKETASNAKITKTRNLCFFDGSAFFDGSRIMNSLYEKEGL